MPAHSHSPSVIRCIASKEGSQYVAMSLEFGLAAQADSLAEAKQKLEAQIKDYVKTALTETPEFRSALLRRRAPLWAYFNWYRIKFSNYIGGNRRADKGDQAFTEESPPLALV